MKHSEIIQEGIRLSRERGRPYTPHDLLHDLGITDIGDYRRGIFQIQRDLKHGAKHHDLLGPVFVLSETNRGKPPTGYGENPPPTAPNEEDIVFNSRHLTTVLSSPPNYRLPQSAEERNALLASAVKLPAAVQKQIAATLQSGDAELRVANAEAEANRRVADEAQKRADEATENAVFLRDLVNRFAPTGASEVAETGSVITHRPSGVHGRA